MENQEKKYEYIIVGGRVISKNDGDEHYISAHKLAQLYGVDPTKCLLIEEGDPVWKERLLPGAIRILRPRYDGDYSLT